MTLRPAVSHGLPFSVFNRLSGAAFAACFIGIGLPGNHRVEDIPIAFVQGSAVSSNKKGEPESRLT
jgi:hypothetical protein